MLYNLSINRPAGTTQSCFQLSSVPGLIGSLGISDDLAEILSQSFLWETIKNNSGMGRDVYSLTLFIQVPTFPLLTTALPTLQDVLQDGFWEAIIACDMHKPCMFLAFGFCQNRFLRAHKEADFAPHPHWSCAPGRGCGEVSIGTCFFSETASRVHVSQP